MKTTSRQVRYAYVNGIRGVVLPDTYTTCMRKSRAVSRYTGVHYTAVVCRVRRPACRRGASRLFLAAAAAVVTTTHAAGAPASRGARLGPRQAALSPVNARPCRPLSLLRTEVHISKTLRRLCATVNVSRRYHTVHAASHYSRLMTEQTSLGCGIITE